MWFFCLKILVLALKEKKPLWIIQLKIYFFTPNTGSFSYVLMEEDYDFLSHADSLSQRPAFHLINSANNCQKTN